MESCGLRAAEPGALIYHPLVCLGGLRHPVCFMFILLQNTTELGTPQAPMIA